MERFLLIKVLQYFYLILTMCESYNMAPDEFSVLFYMSVVQFATVKKSLVKMSFLLSSRLDKKKKTRH